MNWIVKVGDIVCDAYLKELKVRVTETSDSGIKFKAVCLDKNNPYGWDPNFWNYFYGYDLVSRAKSKKSQKPSKSLPHKDLFFISSKEGKTHKRLASQVNKDAINHLGNSVTQAMSRFEDRFGKKIDPSQAIVWKLVPHSVRKEPNGRFRIGREIK